MAAMLPQQGHRLELTPWVLQRILPPAVDQQMQTTLSQHHFTRSSFDVCTTWQCNVDYAALIGLSLLIKKLQHLNLRRLNSQSIEPVRVDLRELNQSSAGTRQDDHLKGCGRWRWLTTGISGLVEQCRRNNAGTAGSAHVGVDPSTTVSIVQWWR